MTSANNQPIVLIAEDDSLLLETLSFWLEHNGYITKQAANGLEALTLFRTEPIDIIVSDYNMRNMNGEELIDRIKKERPEVPTLLSTGTPDLSLLNLLRYPRFSAIRKPFTPYAFLNALRYVFEMPSPSSTLVIRSAFRIPMSIPVMVGSETIGRTGNISLTGCFVDTAGDTKSSVAQKTQTGDSIDIKLSLPGVLQILNVKGQIAWVRDSGFGVKFTEIPQDVSHTLRNSLNRELDRTETGWFRMLPQNTQAPQ